MNQSNETEKAKAKLTAKDYEEIGALGVERETLELEMEEAEVAKKKIGAKYGQKHQLMSKKLNECVEVVYHEPGYKNLSDEVKKVITQSRKYLQSKRDMEAEKSDCKTTIQQCQNGIAKLRRKIAGYLQDLPLFAGRDKVPEGEDKQPE